MRVVIGLPGRELTIADDDARWLLAELAGGAEPAAALAPRIEDATAAGRAFRPTAGETRTIFQIFERSARPRTRQLRGLEVALHEAIFRR